MPDPVSITNQKLPYKGMDYDALRREGIEYLQQYSGAIWTDYNHHDPGVTILEYLCFGITDLAYRCNFHVRDLLYSSEYNRYDRPSNAFYPPHEILTSAPTTIADLKCLMLDHFKDGLDDIWINPVSDMHGINGLYDFKLRVKDFLNEDEAGRLVERVKSLYLENRALGEDIGHVSILEKRTLSVKALIEISQEVSPTQVLSVMLRNLEKCLTPAIQLKSRDEMIASGMGSDDIFDGPPPLNGFVSPSGFSTPNETIHLSVLRDVIGETEGVLGIRNLVFMLDDITVFSEEVVLDENTCLILSPLNAQPGSHQVSFIRNDQEVAADLNVANQMWQAAVARDDQQLQSKKYQPDDPPVSNKKLEDIAAYHSVQQLFPIVYGITSYGIPGNSSVDQQAFARQLKGYLAIFEILLASSLKQITRLRHLFHVETPGAKSPIMPDTVYATRFPFDIPDIDPLLRLGTEEAGREETENALREMAAFNERPFERRIQFLSHLLSRFGETVETDFLKKIAEWEGENPDQLAVRVLSRMISEYVPAGGRRGTGFDYTKMTPDVQPNVRKFSGISTLKAKLCILLNMPQKADVSCTDFFPFEHFHTPAPDNAGGGIPVKALLRHGGGSNGYDMVEEDGMWILYFVTSGEHGKYKLREARDKATIQSLRDEFIARVRRFDEESTNFYIVEHILLRPLSPKMAKVTFRAPIDGGYILMAPPRYHQPEIVDGWMQSILVTGSNPDNFAIKPDPDAPGQFYVAIIAEEIEILVSKERFPPEIANLLASQISRHMLNIMQENPARLDSLIGPKEWKSDNILNGDADAFYSMRMSIVAPDWPSLFSGADRKRLFERLTLQAAPAHLHIDFIWLNWRQMGHFEELYYSWRLAKATPETSAAIIDVCAYVLAEFLQKASDVKPQ